MGLSIIASIISYTLKGGHGRLGSLATFGRPGPKIGFKKMGRGPIE